MKIQWSYTGTTTTGMFININNSDRCINKLEFNLTKPNIIVRVIVAINVMKSLEKNNIAFSASCNLPQTIKLVVDTSNLQQTNNFAKWLVDNILSMTIEDVVRLYQEIGVTAPSFYWKSRIPIIQQYCTYNKNLGPFTEEIIKSKDLTHYFAKFFLHICPEITFSLLKYYPTLEPQLKAEAEYYMVLQTHEPGEDKNKRLLELAYYAKLETETRCHFIEILGAGLSDTEIQDLNILDPIDILIKYAENRRTA